MCDLKYQRDNRDKTRKACKKYEQKNPNKKIERNKRLRKENKNYHLHNKNNLIDIKCNSCKFLKSIDYFTKNTTTSTGYNRWCKACLSDINKKYYLSNKNQISANMANNRARKRDRMPFWANKEEIKNIYKNRPKGYHVDHIIPLNGKNVSGLHVPCNLQYLPALDNLSKGNKTSSEVDFG